MRIALFVALALYGCLPLLHTPAAAQVRYGYLNSYTYPQQSPSYYYNNFQPYNYGYWSGASSFFNFPQMYSGAYLGYRVNIPPPGPALGAIQIPWNPNHQERTYTNPAAMEALDSVFDAVKAKHATKKDP